MKFIYRFLLLALVFQFSALAQQNNGQDIKVLIENLESNKGKVYISIYNDEASFLNKSLKSDKIQIQNMGCEYVFKNMPAGTYAISFYHDENNNNKMDTNFFGMPKEDYGCSNNARGTMGPPKWKDAKFELKNETITQRITL
ncbi:MAG: DUF2141 domain-containing protein [Bacteroidota bacterium]